MNFPVIVGATLILAAGAAAAETPDALPSTGTKARAPLGQTFPGTFLSKKDIDWVRAKVSKGRTYAALVTTIADNNDSGGDYLRVYNAAGRLIAENKTRGIDSKGLEFKAPYTGDVFLAVSGSQLDNGGEPYPYSVGYYDDCAGNAQTTCSGQLGQSSGQWSYSDDRDWRAVPLRKGQRYTLSFLGEISDQLAAGKISMRDKAGKLLGTTDLDARDFSFNAGYTGRYFIDATDGDFDLTRPTRYQYKLVAAGR